jgi:hypothetical protein
MVDHQVTLPGLDGVLNREYSGNDSVSLGGRGLDGVNAVVRTASRFSSPSLMFDKEFLSP